jgi:hypothetical protein
MKHQTEFEFAGFTWPRDVADLTIGKAALARKFSPTRCTGNYYHAPRPNSRDGVGFYLDSVGQPHPRYVLTEASYYAEDAEFQGIVFRLSHGRYLAGWTMGVNMASSVDRDVYTDENEATLAAKFAAQQAADDEAEYQQAERERMAHEEAEATIGEEG